MGLLLAGCTVVQPVPVQTDQGRGGIGIPQQLEGEAYPGRIVALRGMVWIGDDGCVYLLEDQPRLIVWPAGSELSNPVRLPDGTELHDGDEVTLDGRLALSGDLPGGSDGYWAHVTGFCDAGSDQVVVVSRITRGR